MVLRSRQGSAGLYRDVQAMSVTAKACRKLASQLARATGNAKMGGPAVSVRVKDPAYLIALLRRSARELESR